MQKAIFYAVELTTNEYNVLQEFRKIGAETDSYIYAGGIKVDGLDEIDIEKTLDNLYCKGVIELDEENGDFSISNQSETRTTFFSLNDNTLSKLEENK